MGLLMGKLHQMLTELSAFDKSIFSFLDNSFSKYQLIFTRLSMCIDIVEIWFGIADGHISSIFNTHPYFHLRMITLVNINGFSPNLVYALILWRSALEFVKGKFHQFLTE